VLPLLADMTQPKDKIAKIGAVIEEECRLKCGDSHYLSPMIGDLGRAASI